MDPIPVAHNKNKGLVIFIISISLILFTWLSREVYTGRTFLMDDVVFNLTFSIRSSFLTGLMQVITFLGSSYFLLPANSLMICWILIGKKDAFFALQWAITSIGSLLLMYFFKGFYQRPRPLDPYLASASGFSYPSGHTLNSLVFFGLIIILIWRYSKKKSIRLWVTVMLSVLILAVGLSRNYLRVHYASDVLGGLSLGLLWLLLINLIFQRSFARQQKKLNVEKLDEKKF